MFSTMKHLSAHSRRTPMPPKCRTKPIEILNSNRRENRYMEYPLCGLHEYNIAWSIELIDPLYVRHTITSLHEYYMDYPLQKLYIQTKGTTSSTLASFLTCNQLPLSLSYSKPKCPTHCPLQFYPSSGQLHYWIPWMTNLLFHASSLLKAHPLVKTMSKRTTAKNNCSYFD